MAFDARLAEAWSRLPDYLGSHVLVSLTALAIGLGRLRLAFDILALLRGRFDGRPGHWRALARSLDVWLEDETALELDGEIASAEEVHFDIFPERIRLCA